MAKRAFSAGMEQNRADFNAYSFPQRIKMLSLDKVLPNDKNFFSIDDEDIELLMYDIETQGVQHNLVVKDNEDGTYTIISGHKRREAVRRLHEEKGYTDILPCSIRTYNSDDEEDESLMNLNTTQRRLKASELMRCYEKYKDIFDRKKTNGEVSGRIRELIAIKLGVSDSQIKKVENVKNNAIEAIKQAVEKDEISISQANELASLTAEKQEELVKNNSVSAIKPKKIKQEKSKEKTETKAENTENSQPDSEEKSEENTSCGICTTENDGTVTKDTANTKTNNDENSTENTSCGICTTENDEMVTKDTTPENPSTEPVNKENSNPNKFLKSYFSGEKIKQTLEFLEFSEEKIIDFFGVLELYQFEEKENGE
ncbi:MAG: ParB N-terminal domain-containing protein [Oscillospiraceae bacterium]|jgi:ParB family chromosome partitioning protein|nr:ParB N-terminal domain-containing protein [Oscillospiraceae bacterium]